MGSSSEKQAAGLVIIAFKIIPKLSMGSFVLYRNHVCYLAYRHSDKILSSLNWNSDPDTINKVLFQRCSEM